MMTTYAIVEGDVIVNVIVWDGATEFVPPTGMQAVQIPANVYTGIGGTYSNGVFTAPPYIGSIL